MLKKSHHTGLYSALHKVNLHLKSQPAEHTRHTSGLGVTPPECRFCWSTALQGSRSDSGLGMSEHPGLGEGCGGVRLRRSSLSEQWEAATGAGGAPDNGFSFLRDPVCHIQYEISHVVIDLHWMYKNHNKHSDYMSVRPVCYRATPWPPIWPDRNLPSVASAPKKQMEEGI